MRARDIDREPRAKSRVGLQLRSLRVGSRGDERGGNNRRNNTRWRGMKARQGSETE